MKRIIKYIFTRIKCLNFKVQAEAGAYIGFSCKIVNAGGIITLGRKAKVRPQTHLYASEGAVIEIGENTEIGRSSTISSVQHRANREGCAYGAASLYF